MTRFSLSTIGRGVLRGRTGSAVETAGYKIHELAIPMNQIHFELRAFILGLITGIFAGYSMRVGFLEVE
jgi:hypothetical protein